MLYLTNQVGVDVIITQARVDNNSAPILSRLRMSDLKPSPHISVLVPLSASSAAARRRRRRRWR